MNDLELAFARSNQRRDIMAVVVAIAVVAGAFGPYWVPAILGPVRIGTMRDGGGYMGMMLMPFALVMGIGWIIATMIARRRVR
jgi:hypothetical protein